ncbi:MAG: hypothetical protein NPMRTH4_2010013 [Nitrosopumilales archaeon]|nr:MAG: hypothetical protein NPMRTH4_2010013 [Nitrosopumilales archaeon]
MSDDILDNVKKLLDAEVGDIKILEQIKRAAENNEVISNYERNYVAKLSEQHLKPPEPEPELEPEIETPVESIQEEISVEKEQMEKIEQVTPTQTIVELKPTYFRNKKFMMIGGGAALAIIILVAIGASGIENFGTGLNLEIDKSSYNSGDIISLSGNSKTTLGSTISLFIENSDGEQIWSEDLKIKDNGTFSTLLIAGGTGWEGSGTYSIKAEHGSEQLEITFSFNNS